MFQQYDDVYVQQQRSVAMCGEGKTMSDSNLLKIFVNEIILTIPCQIEHYEF